VELAQPRLKNATGTRDIKVTDSFQNCCQERSLHAARG
jgi:hypothetical protein